MTTKVKGFNDINKRLKTMSKGVMRGKIDLENGLREVGYKTAMDKVPVDTGELKGSIKTVDAFNNQDSKPILIVDAKHAKAVEFGTFKTPEQPYFRPAVEEMKEYLEKNIGGVIDDT